MKLSDMIIQKLSPPDKRQKQYVDNTLSKPPANGRWNGSFA